MLEDKRRKKQDLIHLFGFFFVCDEENKDYDINGMCDNKRKREFNTKRKKETI